MKKSTNEEFIKKAKERFYDKNYDYSKVEYTGIFNKVKIICPIHGEFEQQTHYHLHKSLGCPHCSVKKSTTEEFIIKAKQTHPDKNYDYSLVEYINAHIKVKIICKDHGIFEQVPNSHLRGRGCPECAKKIISDYKSSNTEEFIIKAKQAHPDKNYDYSKVDYINNSTNVIIICPEHGEFEQKPHNHLLGKGCPICAGNKKSNTEEFIIKAKQAHPDKNYDYSKVDYKGAQIKVIIICSIHGEFKQTPTHHLTGNGCPGCGRITIRLKRIKEIETNKYNGLPLIPSFNTIGCEILNKIAKETRTKIKHAMNGGEYKIEKLGYYLDGYDEENNIVYEIDEPQHFLKGELREEDKKRESEIKNILNCEFIRIKAKKSKPSNSH